MTKFYRALCRFCSGENHPEFVSFKEEDGIVECRRCNAKHKLVPVDSAGFFTTLELIDSGNTRR